MSDDKANIIILEVALITLGFFSYLSWVNDGNPYASCCGLLLCVVFAIFNILLAFYLKWERDEKKKKEKQYQKDFLAYIESQEKEDEKMTLKEYLTTRTETGYFAEVYDKAGDLPWAIVFIDSNNVFIERMNQQLLARAVTRAEFTKDGSYTGEIYRIEVE